MKTTADYMGIKLTGKLEPCETCKTSMKFDRMIPSGSSWLMGIKTKRLVGQEHAAIEPGKSIPIWKFH